MRGLGIGLVLLLLVGATPACLLYTDRINHPPVVASVSWPSQISAHFHQTLVATATDPDGDAVTIAWSRLESDCKMATPAEWANAPATPGPQFQLDVSAHSAFCLRVVARDSAGAEAAVFWRGLPGNQAPEVKMAVRPAAEPSGMYPLWSDVSLSAGSMDPDGDSLTYVWDVRDPTGASVSTTRCGPSSQPDMNVCFTADHPGVYHATVTVSDGEKSTSADLTMTVAEDQPPCLEATDPSIDTPELVLGVNDPVRPFEVRQVRDDGDPWPPGPHGASTFRWYLARDQGPFTRQIMFDGATFPVSAGLFPGARPGDVVRVRVEARDPAHDSAAGVRDLDDCDDTRRICERPAGCARLVSWSVRLQ